MCFAILRLATADESPHRRTIQAPNHRIQRLEDSQNRRINSLCQTPFSLAVALTYLISQRPTTNPELCLRGKWIEIG